MCCPGFDAYMLVDIPFVHMWDEADSYVLSMSVNSGVLVGSLVVATMVGSWKSVDLSLASGLSPA